MTEACDALVVPVAAAARLSGPAAAVDAATGGALEAVRNLGDFDGRVQSTRLVHISAGLQARRVLLVGTGDGGGDATENGRLAGGAAIQILSGMTVRAAAVVLPERSDDSFVQGLTEGLGLASYRFDWFHSCSSSSAWNRSWNAVAGGGFHRSGCPGLAMLTGADGDDGNPASGFTLEMDLRVDITVDGQGSISRVWTRRLASGAQTQISASGGLVVIRPGGRLATARRWVADLVA